MMTMIKMKIKKIVVSREMMLKWMIFFNNIDSIWMPTWGNQIIIGQQLPGLARISVIHSVNRGG